MVSEATKNGASLIGFPESILPTYPYWVWLENPFKWRQKYSQAFYENAFEMDGPHTKKLCQIAKTYGAYLVVGVSERQGGTIFNSQIFISEKGRIDGVHRKLIPTFAERSVWGRGDGSTLNTFQTTFGVVGGLICGEHNMPLARYALLSQHEEIHFASFPAFPFKSAVLPYQADIAVRNHALEGRAVLPYQADIAVRNHALEGQVFVINSSSYLSKEMIDHLFETEEEKSMLEESGNGFSCIVNPLGYYIAGPLTDSEGILYAEIDRSEIFKAKRTLDAVGHYSRPDVLNLKLNKSEQKNLHIEGSEKSNT